MANGIIVYDAYHGEAVADARVASKVSEIITYIRRVSENPNGFRRANTICLIYSTENIIMGFRVAIKEGRLRKDEIRFIFRAPSPDYGVAGQEIEIFFNRDGRSDNWPDGFCDTTDKMLMKLLDW